MITIYSSTDTAIHASSCTGIDAYALARLLLKEFDGAYAWIVTEHTGTRVSAKPRH